MSILTHKEAVQNPSPPSHRSQEDGISERENFMKNCPCCSMRLLQHIRNNQTYWFCRNCWQEMPLLDLEGHRSFLTSRRIKIGGKND